MIALKNGDSRAAYTQFQKVVELKRGDVDAKIALAGAALQVFIDGGKQSRTTLDQASELALAALKQKPDSKDALRVQATVLMFYRSYDEAIAMFRRADAQGADSTVRLLLVQSLLAAGKVEGGEALAQSELQRASCAVELFDVMYRHYASTGRLRDAESTLILKSQRYPNKPEYIRELAEFYSASGRSAEAKATLEKLGGRSDGAEDLATFYYATGEYDRAIEALTAGLTRSPDNKALLQRRLTATLAAKGDFAGAIAQTDLLLKSAPGDVDARAMKVSLSLQSGDAQRINEALKLVQGLLAERPNDPGLLYNLGRCHFLKGDITAARKAFVQAAQDRPNFYHPRLYLIKIHQAHQEHSQAVQVARGILEVTDIPQVRVLRAQSLTLLGHFSEAANDLHLARSTEGESLSFRVAAARLAAARGDLKSTIALFSDLRRAYPKDTEVLSSLVDVLVRQGRGAEALQMIEAELKTRPADRDLNRLRVVTSIGMNDLDRALQFARAWVALNASSPEAQLYLGQVLHKRDDAGGAAAAWQRADALNPDDPTTAMLLASALDRAGRRGEAIQKYRAVIKRQPGNAPVLNNLAFLIADTGGNLNEALGFAQGALKASPDTASYSDTLGYVLLKKNDVDLALPIFTRLAAKHPQSATYRFHLGQALAKKGRQSEARAEYSAALLLSPGKSEAEQMRTALNALPAKASVGQ